MVDFKLAVIQITSTQFKKAIENSSILVLNRRSKEVFVIVKNSNIYFTTKFKYSKEISSFFSEIIVDNLKFQFSLFVLYRIIALAQ